MLLQRKKRMLLADVSAVLTKPFYMAFFSITKYLISVAYPEGFKCRYTGLGAETMRPN